MTIPLALAVARRALVVAVVAVLVAIAALVAALLSGSDGDPPEIADTSQAQADVAAVLAETREAAAMAAAAAARAEEAAAAVLAAATSVEESAFIAQEAATLAQEAAGAAFEASVKADMAAANVAAAEEPLAEASDGTGTATSTDDAAGPSTTVEDTEEDAEAVAEEDAAAADDESEPAPADDAPEDGSEQTPEDPAVSLPGEPYEFGPAAGTPLAVVGVFYDSVLNVRDVPAGEIVAVLDVLINVVSQPGVNVRHPDSYELLASLDLKRGLFATGNTRKLPTTIWHEIRMADAVGWASSAYLAPLGATSDATTEIVAVLGETPAAPTLEELARVVAEAVASDDPPSRIVVSGTPVLGDLGEVTVDVLGLPDDAVRGFRLQVFAEQDSESGLFTLRTVESTTICDSHRGVSEEGLCN